MNHAKSSTFNKHVLRILSREYRTLNLKTIYDGIPQLAESLNEQYPDALIAFVRHEPEDAVQHYHLVVRFQRPTNLKKFLSEVAENDGCFYAAPCRLFKSSYRYLAHLDSPEKHKVSVDSIVRLGDWDTIPLCDWHLIRRQSVDLSEMVLVARDFLLECGADSGSALPPVSLVQFGCWLEGKGFNARSALSSLRMMGISFEDLCREAVAMLKGGDK